MAVPNIIIFGSGGCALAVAEGLDAQGVKVTVAGARMAGGVPPGIDLLEGMQLIHCGGQAGGFELLFQRGSTRTAVTAAAIVVAEDAQVSPNFAHYGLQPSPRVVALSELEARFAAGAAATIGSGAWVAFFNSWQQESHPAVAERMLRLCLQVQCGGASRTVFMTGNLKVAAEGSEACYQEAKAAGTVFLKFHAEMPRIETMGDGRVAVGYRDETTRSAFQMAADYVVVDESIQAHPSLIRLAERMRLDCDASGFIQSDNVRRLSNLTNRRGIFVAGGSRALEGYKQQRDDAVQVVSAVDRFICGKQDSADPEVVIDQGRCARCLTCYRLCPHAAIEMVPHMHIVPQACQSCGLCTAGCPNQAIRVEDADLAKGLQALPQPLEAPPESRLAVFCCRRSASLARDLAMAMGRRLPAGMLFVEGLCSGTFSVNHLLSAFAAGIQGVMVSACHPGNCQSESGTLHARKRVDQVARALVEAGVAPERVAYCTLSANMGSEFAHLAEEFARRIAALGPLNAQSSAHSAQETYHG